MPTKPDVLDVQRLTAMARGERGGDNAVLAQAVLYTLEQLAAAPQAQPAPAFAVGDRVRVLHGPGNWAGLEATITRLEEPVVWVAALGAEECFLRSSLRRPPCPDCQPPQPAVDAAEARHPSSDVWGMMHRARRVIARLCEPREDRVPWYGDQEGYICADLNAWCEAHLERSSFTHPTPTGIPPAVLEELAAAGGRQAVRVWDWLDNPQCDKKIRIRREMSGPAALNEEQAEWMVDQADARREFCIAARNALPELRAIIAAHPAPVVERDYCPNCRDVGEAVSAARAEAWEQAAQVCDEMLMARHEALEHSRQYHNLSRVVS